MDETYAREMSALTRAFYDEVYDSFSATRRSPWAGWERLIEVLGLTHDDELRLLDIACGNLRFEEFMASRLNRIETWCMDVCDDLVLSTTLRSGADLHYRHVDVAEVLLADDLRDISVDTPHELAVSFGFMHHLPLAIQRRRLLAHLVDEVRVGGHVCVSFWQFERDERIMRGATSAPGGAPGDYLLGWQGSTRVQRFCHSTAEAEIDELVSSLADVAEEAARYSADGKSGDLNRYLVLRRVR